MTKKKKRRSPNVPDSSQPAAQPQSGSKRISQRQRKRKQGQMWIWIAGGVAIVLVAVLIILNNTSRTTGAPPDSSLPTELVSANTAGPADAKVVIQEFSDFQCPHCKTFAESTAGRIREDYVVPGLARFEFKYYPLPSFEPGATWAANAAACAGDQGKFWEMHDFLFQEQGTQGPNTFTQNRLRSMAEQLGLDTSQFDTCLSREEHRQEILDSSTLGRQLGVTGTPTVFVNGQRVNSDYASIKAAIDAELQKAG